MSDANMRDANMRGANMRGADMSGANMRDANMRGADMRGANMRDANMRDADMRGADMSGADMRGIPLANLPKFFVNSCSRDILFVLEHLKAEVPFLRDKLIKGEVDGSQYEGECACLIGTLGNADGGVDAVCKAIPFYEKSVHNPGETWFLNIRKGDTPENNEFAKHVLTLIDIVLDPTTNEAS